MGKGGEFALMREEKLRAGKFDVDVPLVERLVATQFPRWSGLQIRPVERDGWDNWTFRLGDRLKVRLPSAMSYNEQAEKEAHWLPKLAPLLPVPVPIGIGRPSAEYPCAWSIYEWLDGEPVTREAIGQPGRFATDLANFLVALQRIDTAGGPPPGPHNFFRGAPPMTIYGDEARRSVEALGGVIDAPVAHAVLDAAAAASVNAPAVWIHGDIAVGNLLVIDGRLSAVIDFGGCAVGDPACDLVVAWVFLTGQARNAFRAAAPGDAGTWARARGWALWKAMLLLGQGLVINSAENSPHAVIEAVLAEHRALRPRGR